MRKKGFGLYGAFWDGEKVVVFKEGKKHQFERIDEAWGEVAGSCVIYLSHWRDPAMTIGRR